MYFLGIAGFWHDPAACLIRDNRIVAMAEEERFNRIKHAQGHFPWRAIDFCLKREGIKITDVDKIGYYLNPSFKNLFWNKKHIFFKSPEKIAGAIKFKRLIPKFVWGEIKKHFKANPDIIFIDHHIAHAASAYFVSGFDKASILTIDGAGESATTLMASGDEYIEVIKEFHIPNSLGTYYQAFTEFLGFEANEGEGKVMGLAPYGNRYMKIFDKVVRTTKNGFEVDQKFISGSEITATYSDYLVRIFGEPRLPHEEITERHKNVAFSLQKRLEDVAKHLVEKLVEMTGYKNLCLAGGVCLNSKMNGEILASGLIGNIFIQPGAGDAGCALGCALQLAVEEGLKFDKMEHVYYGPEYSNEEIEKILKEARLKFEYYKDIAGIVAELISKGNIVGWFQGKMEFGPRALGNRSILADPRDPEIKNKLNYFVKHREPFRPFCPSLLDKYRKNYQEIDYESPYMILITKVPEESRKDIPGVIHVDGTIRPQTVTKNVNPLYYKLIEKFYKLTGVPVILNTSFNVRGEPMVCKPQEAIADFYRTGMDALAIGNYLLKK